MEYLLKASAIITLFYLFYRLFLQKETFFNHNRWFLIIGLILALTTPLVVIPIYVEAPFGVTESLFISNASNIAPTVKPITLIDVLFWVYLIVSSIIFAKLCIEFISLGITINKHRSKTENAFKIIETKNNIAPFSFFNWIVYNPNHYSKQELNYIITHEKIHGSELHSIDIIISHLACVLLWFNPFIWLYKKELQQNLEFIADSKTQERTENERSYQHLLLKSSLQKHQLIITNNFYNSLIKKRIVMLHKSKSKKLNQLKSVLILPLLALFLMSFNTEKVYIESENTSKKNNLNEANQTVIITKDYTDSDFAKLEKQLKKEGIILNVKNIKRNSDNEIIGIKIEVKSKGSNANFNSNSDEPINPIKISFDREGNNLSIGNMSELHFNGDHNYFFKSGDDGKSFVVKRGDAKHKITEAHSHGKSNGTVIEFKDEDGKKESIYFYSDDKDKKHNHKNEFKVRSIGKGDEKVIIMSNDDKEPIYILDGKEVKKDKIDKLDTKKIDKIEVLKGDSAAEAYGKKGKNGVVVITTKKE